MQVRGFSKDTIVIRVTLILLFGTILNIFFSTVNFKLVNH